MSSYVPGSGLNNTSTTVNITLLVQIESTLVDQVETNRNSISDLNVNLTSDVLDTGNQLDTIANNITENDSNTSNYVLDTSNRWCEYQNDKRFSNQSNRY